MITTKEKKKEKKTVLNFNDPFCKSVAVRVGKCFLSIVDKNFTKDHPYSEVFNMKTFKIPYSSMKNMKLQIMAHNRRVLNNNKEKTNKCTTAQNKNSLFYKTGYLKMLD